MASSPRVDVRVPEPALRWLDARAAREGLSRSDVLRELLVEVIPDDAWPEGHPRDVDPRGRRART